jgi:Fe2+ transport system protein FeoA
MQSSPAQKQMLKQDTGSPKPKLRKEKPTRLSPNATMLRGKDSVVLRLNINDEVSKRLFEMGDRTPGLDIENVEGKPESFVIRINYPNVISGAVGVKAQPVLNARESLGSVNGIAFYASERGICLELATKLDGQYVHDMVNTFTRARIRQELWIYRKSARFKFTVLPPPINTMYA